MTFGVLGWPDSLESWAFLLPEAFANGAKSRCTQKSWHSDISTSAASENRLSFKREYGFFWTQGVGGGGPGQVTYYFFRRLFHRVSTALRPCALSSSLLSLAARAFPPLRPSATACGFFPMLGLYYVPIRRFLLHYVAPRSTCCSKRKTRHGDHG